MARKLTWAEIEREYDKQWVQLVDYDWPEGVPHPEAGIVRVHAADRKDFFRKVAETPARPHDSAFVYVGIPPKQEGVVYNNFHTVIS